MSNLSTKAMLVSLNISQWSARKLDKNATNSVNSTYGAKSGAGNYNKKLLPSAKELESINSIASRVRKYFYEQTLPWLNDGTRIISSKNYLNFQKEFRSLHDAFNNAVNEFSLAYPQLVIDAKNTLGNLYDASEYPTDIASRFSIDLDFFPMPNASDFRVDISDAEKNRLTQKIKETEQRAMIEASTRLLEVIKTAVTKLNDPSSIFRDTLLGNIAEVAKLMPMLNISDDPQLEKLSQEAIDIVNQIDLEEVRTDSTKRVEASTSLADIESKMSAFMGTLK